MLSGQEEMFAFRRAVSHFLRDCQFLPSFIMNVLHFFCQVIGNAVSKSIV